MTSFKKAWVSLAAAILLMQNFAAVSDPLQRVTVTGTRSCPNCVDLNSYYDSGRYLDGFMSMYADADTGGSGDAGGGGDEIVEVAANRFTPGCQREEMMMKSIAAAATTRDPIESTIPRTMLQLDRYLWSAAEDFTDKLSGGVKDDLYKDPSWRKVKVIVQGIHYPTLAAKMTGEGGLDWIIEVHFWRNDLTRQVEQVKLKNTKAEGCRGEESGRG